MMTESSIGLARPVDVLQDLVLFVPDRRDVCVRQKNQTDIAKTSFRKIYDHVVGRIPRQEYTGLCPARRIDSAFKKADPRVTPSRRRENPKAIVHDLVRAKQFQ